MGIKHTYKKGKSMRLFNLIKNVIYQLKCRRLCNKIEDDKKIEFEKEVIELLKKFNLYNLEGSSLQKATIIVDADTLPVVKLEYLVLSRDKKKKKE